MTDIAIDSIVLRGSDARRLAVVASRSLPAALERALADLGDIQVPLIEVTLDARLEGLDDETIAALWATAIRTEVVAAGATPRTRSERVAASGIAGETTARATSSRRDARVVARLWLEAGDKNAPVPRGALTLARERSSDDPRAGESGADAELVHRLATALGLRETQDTSSPADASPADIADAATDPPNSRTTHHLGDNGFDSERVDATPRPPAQASRREGDAPEPGPAVSSHSADAAALDAIADLLHPSASSLDPLTLTRAGGLPLVFPWLADLGRAAEALHPERDPLELRLRAFAAVVDPGDVSMLDDPVVGLLAGASPDRPLSRPAPLERDAEIVDQATAVVHRLAALLPGFTESTPGFVRQAWIQRHGILETGRSPARLTSASHPLDVILGRLPYPLGLIKLPWSPPLSVRFRP